MSDAAPTAGPAPRKQGELVGIQYLRAIAAMMVVVFHLDSQLDRMGYTGYWPGGLSSGVDVFFVISGLIMWVTTAGRTVSPWQFWKKRIVRIVPLYWIFTSLMVALMLAAPHLLQTSRFELHHTIMSYLFLPALHPVKGSMEPVLMPGWTLNYEMFFYLVFGLWLLARDRVRLIGTNVTLIVLVAAGALAGLSPLSVGGFYTSSIMLEFLFGMALGAIATRGDLFNRVPAWAGWIMLAGGLLFVSFASTELPPEWPRIVTRGIASLATVAGMMVLEAHGRVGNSRTLRLLGDASYSIYLSHVVTLSAASQAWRKLGLDHWPGGVIAFCIVAVIVSAVVGVISYRLLEQPLTRLFRPRGQAGARVMKVSA